MAKDRSGVEYLGVRKDGKKYFKLHVTWKDPLTGKKREAEKTDHATNKLQAMQKRAKFRQEKIEGPAVPVERRPFRSVGDEWIETVTRHGTKKSWKSYMKTFMAWEVPGSKGTKLGDAWIDVIGPQLLQTYLASCAARGLEVTTMRGHRNALSHIFEHAKELGLVKSNPVLETRIKKPKPTVAVKRKRKALTPEEAELFMVDIQQQEPDVYTLLMTQYVLGCRFAEVSALHRPDIDTKTGLVEISRGQVDGVLGPPKNNTARTAAVGISGLQLLVDHLKRMDQLKWPGHDLLVFPRSLGGQGRSLSRRYHNYWTIDAVGGAIRRSFKRLGLEMGAVTHVARHTMNNIARMHGNEAFMRRVREAIGHSGEKMSAKYSELHTAEVLEIGQTMEKAIFRRSGTQSGSSGVSVRTTPKKKR